MSLITHIELISGGVTWRIAASMKNSPSTIRKGVVITDVKSIMSPGEINEDPMIRSYSDGYVWNKEATRSGKNISIPITFFSDTFETDFISFDEFLQDSVDITLKTYGRFQRTYTCQALVWPAENIMEDQAFACNLMLATKEAH